MKRVTKYGNAIVVGLIAAAAAAAAAVVEVVDLDVAVAVAAAAAVRAAKGSTDLVGVVHRVIVVVVVVANDVVVAVVAPLPSDEAIGLE